MREGMDEYEQDGKRKADLFAPIIGLLIIGAAFRFVLWLK